MDRAQGDRNFFNRGDAGRPKRKAVRLKRDWDARPTASNHRDEGGWKLFKPGKLQIAGILLIIVFIWGIISALAIGMFEIHLLALTEFEDDRRADVYGYVTDENGQPLVNVTVVVHGTHHFAKTNPEGFYSIENVKEGDYEIEASRDGYGSVTKRISLDAYIPRTVNFALEEGGYEKTKNERYGSNLSDLRFLNHATAIFLVVYGSLALIGGFLAYFLRFYWIAMIGGVSGIVSGVLSIGIIIGSVLSIIALALIVRHREEFITSETSFIDRLFGVRQAGTGVGGVRRGAQKFKGYGAPTKLRAKDVKPRYVERGFTPPTKAVPIGRMKQLKPPAQRGATRAGKPPLTCIVCKGTIKTESHGVVCRCGACYHRFCAKSISVCRRCGNIL